MRWAMAIFYAGAGLLHIFVAIILPIVPDFVPFHRAVVIVTGSARLLRRGAHRRPAAPPRRPDAGALRGLRLSANIKHAFGGVHIAGLPDGWWYHAPRLALQPVLVWWALFASGCIDWPFQPAPEGNRTTAADETPLERRP